MGLHNVPRDHAPPLRVRIRGTFCPTKPCPQRLFPPTNLKSGINYRTAESGGLHSGNSDATYGGGIHCRMGSSPTFTRCRITDNSATYGGGLACTGSTPTLVDCDFTQNSAGPVADGAGLYSYGGARPTLSLCTFESNDGGGLCCEGAGVELEDCDFITNTALHGAGILLDDPQDVIATDCEFRGNHASVSGGGIYLRNASTLTTLTGCTFVADTSDGAGGGVWSDYSPVAFTDCTFDNCVCIGDGGAVKVVAPAPASFLRCQFNANSAANGGGIVSYWSTEVTLNDCTFEGNDASTYGGAIRCYNTSLLSATDCDFLANTAMFGGGIAADSTTTSVDSCLFQDNSAETDGGAMLLEAGENDDVTQCLFWGNTSGILGGGVALFECVSDTFRSCTFSDNAVNEGIDAIGGGAVFQLESESFFHNCSYTRNEGASGGGVYCIGPSCNMLGCTFVGNTNSGGYFEEGGAIYAFEPSLSIRGSVFASDSASLGGAVFAENGGNLNILSSTIYGCHSSTSVACGIYLREDVTLDLERVIISHGTQGEAIASDGTGVVTTTCCDVYGNAGGDWIGPIAGQLGLNGNISEDPLYCDAPNGEYSIHANSPCAPFSEPNPECDLVGAHMVGCGSDVTNEFPGSSDLTLLLRPAPNPMFGDARIVYTVPYRIDKTTLRVRLAVYDALGRLVRHLVDKEQPTGIHGVTWDGTNEQHQTTGAGVYYCRLQVGTDLRVRSMIRVE
ncbi:right-handed parallel beta-helix repeat-containing protein [Candidatus Eisenbacteria bacterium]|uniref:Right-handed parallel beta-helix repeat-containing protein n=1 Tax=Eiseniibacteriota bacterium TaxID=2212470 RepID=A0ABV6YLW1_UNCEI